MNHTNSFLGFAIVASMAIAHGAQAASAIAAESGGPNRSAQSQKPVGLDAEVEAVRAEFERRIAHLDLLTKEKRAHTVYQVLDAYNRYEGKQYRDAANIAASAPLKEYWDLIPMPWNQDAQLAADDLRYINRFGHILYAADLSRQGDHFRAAAHLKSVADFDKNSPEGFSSLRLRLIPMFEARGAEAWARQKREREDARMAAHRAEAQRAQAASIAKVAALDAKGGFQRWKLNSQITSAVRAMGVKLNRYDGAVTYNSIKEKFGQTHVYVTPSYFKDRLYEIEVSNPYVPGMYDDTSLQVRSMKAFYDSLVAAYGEPSQCGVVECWIGKKVKLVWYGTQGTGGVSFRYLPIEAAIKGGQAAQQRAEDQRRKNLFNGAQNDL